MDSGSCRDSHMSKKNKKVGGGVDGHSHVVDRGRPRSRSSSRNNNKNNRRNHRSRRRRHRSSRYDRHRHRRRSSKDRNRSRRRESYHRRRRDSYSRNNRRRESKERRRDGKDRRRDSTDRRRRDDSYDDRRSYEKRRSRSERTPSSEKDDTVGSYRGAIGDIIGKHYRSMKELGEGTFGRVVECVRVDDQGKQEGSSPEVVAIKVVRSVPRYVEEAQIEADIIAKIQEKGTETNDKDALERIVHLFDQFMWKDHFCLVFEALDCSLYDYQRKTQYKPVQVRHIRGIAADVFQALDFLHNQMKLVHTDIKLENVLFEPRSFAVFPPTFRVKLIDFGGATFVNPGRLKTSLINTRQYRSPEVTLEVGWSFPSDVWSVGCLLMELLCGDLLFQTHEETEHLALIEKIIGPFPSWIAQASRKNTDFFDSDGMLRWPPHKRSDLYDPERIEFVNKCERLDALITSKCLKQFGKKQASSEEIAWFSEFVPQTLIIDPRERIKTRDAFLRARIVTAAPSSSSSSSK